MVCLSNLRGLGNAVLEFAANNQGKILPRKLPDNLRALEPGVNSYWIRRLYQEGYLDDGPVNTTHPLPKSYYCPSLVPDGPLEVTSSHTYGMRAWRGTKITLDYYLPMNIVDHPSRFFLLADSISGRTQWYTIQLGDGQSNAVHSRHNGRANTFFLDGHVEAAGKEYFESLIVQEPEFTYRPFTVVPEHP